MDDIIIIKLVTGAEIIGRRVSNTLNGRVVLTEALNALVRPNPDNSISYGVAPLSLYIAEEPGKTGHIIECDPSEILIYGPPVKEIEQAYRQATSRVEIAHAIPSRRRAG